MNKNQLCFLLIVLGITFSCNQSGRDQGADKKSASGNNPDSADIQGLEAEVRAHPDSFALRFRLVNAFSKLGKLKEAIAQTDSLIGRDSANAAFWYKRGELLLEASDTIASLESLKKSVRFAPMFMEPKLKLATIYAAQNSPLALVLADQVIQFSEDPPTQTQAHFIKGLYFSNNNENQKAIRQFDTCIINDYTFLDAYIEKGLILYDLKDFANALKVYEKAILVSNTYAEAYFQAGRCELALGNKEEASNYFQKAAGLDKSYQGAADTLQKIK